ncbi:MAG: hypothetical protein HY904_20485 [Deltaproteobacteria bacterium]|nr:hypothetical protein [Deltaproteobacteria bacterium]
MSRHSALPCALCVFTVASVWTGCSVSSGPPDENTESPPRQAAPGPWVRPERPVHPDPAVRALAWRMEFRTPLGLVGPRMAEFMLEYEPGMTFLEAVPGGAVMQAGKKIVVKPLDGARLRVLVFSSENTTRLGSGDWFTLRFSGARGSVRVLAGESQFAPGETEVSDATVALVPGEEAG